MFQLKILRVMIPKPNSNPKDMVTLHTLRTWERVISTWVLNLDAKSRHQMWTCGLSFSITHYLGHCGKTRRFRCLIGILISNTFFLHEGFVPKHNTTKYIS